MLLFENEREVEKSKKNNTDIVSYWLPSESSLYPIEGTFMETTAELCELVRARGIMLKFK